MANYIFGLPGETKKYAKTFDLSLELCTAGWNTYASMAFPAANFIKKLLIKKWIFPKLTKLFLAFI